MKTLFSRAAFQVDNGDLMLGRLPLAEVVRVSQFSIAIRLCEGMLTILQHRTWDVIRKCRISQSHRVGYTKGYFKLDIRI